MKYVIIYHLYGRWDWQSCTRIDELIEFQFRTDYAPNSSISGWYYITQDGINEALSGGERKSEFVGGDCIWVLPGCPDIEHNGYLLSCDSIARFVDLALLPRFTLLCREIMIQLLTSILTVEVL